MTERFFVDTNLLVYCFDTAAGKKQELALEWLQHLWKTRTGAVSLQVLNEFYVCVTQKLKPGMKPQVARRKVIDLFAWKPVALDEKLLVSAWEAVDRHALSFWDSLIVAAARLADCSHLLTEDLADGQTLMGIQVVNPFRRKPAI